MIWPWNPGREVEGGGSLEVAALPPPRPDWVFQRGREHLDGGAALKMCNVLMYRVFRLQPSSVATGYLRLKDLAASAVFQMGHR